MKTVAITRNKPQSLNNIDEFIEQLKWLLHKTRFGGIVTITFGGKGFNNINELMVYVQKDIANNGAYKTNVDVLDVKTIGDKVEAYPKLRLIKTA